MADLAAENCSGDARDVWLALMNGQWTLLESLEVDGRCILVARRSREDLRDARALSSMESRVVALAATGQTDKLIGYHLGVAEGTVSASLCRALRKLQISGRIELVRQLGSGCHLQLAATEGDKPPVTTLPMPEGARVTQLGADSAVLEFPLPTATLPPGLTEAEREVAVLVFEGATSQQIAAARGASIKTVGNQLGSIFRKLDVCSRVELVIYLQRTSAECH